MRREETSQERTERCIDAQALEPEEREHAADAEVFADHLADGDAGVEHVGAALVHDARHERGRLADQTELARPVVVHRHRRRRHLLALADHAGRAQLLVQAAGQHSTRTSIITSSAIINKSFSYSYIVLTRVHTCTRMYSYTGSPRRACRTKRARGCRRRASRCSWRRPFPARRARTRPRARTARRTWTAARTCPCTRPPSAWSPCPPQSPRSRGTPRRLQPNSISLVYRVAVESWAGWSRLHDFASLN